MYTATIRSRHFSLVTKGSAAQWTGLLAVLYSLYSLYSWPCVHISQLSAVSARWHMLIISSDTQCYVTHVVIKLTTVSGDGEESSVIVSVAQCECWPPNLNIASHCSGTAAAVDSSQSNTQQKLDTSPAVTRQWPMWTSHSRWSCLKVQWPHAQDLHRSYPVLQTLLTLAVTNWSCTAVSDRGSE